MSAPMFDKEKRPKVGVGVIVTSKDHPSCVLVGKRKGNAPGEGLYALPGGHLEFGETWEGCATRETLEETGLHLNDVRFYTVCNGLDIENDYHYLELYMVGEVDTNYDVTPINSEPDKCEGWYWIEWDKLAQTDGLFFPLRLLFQLGHNPFDGKTK